MQKKYLESKNKKYFRFDTKGDYIMMSEKLFFNKLGTFVRKQITMITDPDGNPLKFEQDAEGRLLNIYPNDKLARTKVRGF